MVDRRGLALALGAILIVAAACSDRSSVPPRPTRTLEPTVVALVTAVDTDRAPYVVSLASGHEVTLSGLGGTAAVSRSGNLDQGFLWMSDALVEPTWYAWAPPNGTIWPSQDGLDPACWELGGGAFDDGDFVHFSSGLRLPKAADFRVVQEYIKDPWPARIDDVFCVSSKGVVTRLAFIFTPY